jgi:uncharacterized protein YidB (DUF937 family)
MGMLDGLLGSLMGGMTGGGQQQQNPLLAIALQMLQQNGGLEGILGKFQQAGLGQQADSWVSTGQNLPISADQIQAVLGSAEVQALAAKAGIDASRASQVIAEILPQLVDRATPNGQMPAGGILDAISGFFKT